MDENISIEKNIIHFLLQRSLSASTSLNILVQEDLPVYKKQTKSVDAARRNPVISLEMNIFPKASGFSMLVLMKNKQKSFKKRIECKGYMDFISYKMERIHSFICKNSNGLVKGIDRNQNIAQITSMNYDALNHFIRGENAWKKLDLNSAYSEFKTAIEISSDFSLAHLKIAEVELFRGDREDAADSLRKALDNQDRLIEYDLHRLKALKARLDSDSGKERQHLRILTEAFPFKKEYLYEFAESYFYQGDAEEAIKYYLRTLNLDSQYSKAHNHIAFCYSWFGDHEKAEYHFKKYVQLDKTANAYDSMASGYMFAGKYTEAIQAIEKGKQLDPDLDYLYTNLCKNYLLTGKLKSAYRSLDLQEKITDRDMTKINAQFYKAYIDYCRDDRDKCVQRLSPVIKVYSDEVYDNRLDESPALPFWLKGVTAVEKGDVQTLKAVLDRMEQKIKRKRVNATNFSSIYKFYLHLKILHSYLKDDRELILRYIAEGRRIEKKMGHWTSMFDFSYFLNEYAEIFQKLGRREQAFNLLKEIKQYNPHYAAARLNLCKIHLENNDMEKAKKEYEAAERLLTDADEDYFLKRELSSLSRAF